jgi:putative tryptophan/tyrosine transport system substrate-binding protein
VKRREFITLLGGAAFGWPLAARAQQLSKLPRIGFLQRVRNENVVAFIQALRDAGYVDGQNAVIETRIFETTLDRVPDFAKELVDLKCDVILAASQYAFVAAMKATTTIPIVGIDLENDPVASGWVRSLARPGGNFTGLFLDLPELGGKQIELLKEVVPRLSKPGALWDSAIGEAQFGATQTAAQAAGARCIRYRSGGQTISKTPSTVPRANRSMGWSSSHHRSYSSDVRRSSNGR